MLKSGNNHRTQRSVKKGSSKPAFIGALSSGLNRRAFLQQTSIALLVAGISACKPNLSTQANKTEQQSVDNAPTLQKVDKEIFILTEHQKKTLSTVQLKLFPADGDGPSAKDINALEYLQWALTDPDNSADGDGDFIVQGIGWLDSLSEQTKGNDFAKLDHLEQDKVLTQISQSSAGENWLALLIYYLMEALLLDPVYGGNPDGIGWKWLQHQPGFPTPTQATQYRSFS